jgi:hypothetical protein
VLGLWAIPWYAVFGQLRGIPRRAEFETVLTEVKEMIASGKGAYAIQGLASALWQTRPDLPTVDELEDGADFNERETAQIDFES